METFGDDTLAIPTGNSLVEFSDGSAINLTQAIGVDAAGRPHETAIQPGIPTPSGRWTDPVNTAHDWILTNPAAGGRRDSAANSADELRASTIVTFRREGSGVQRHSDLVSAWLRLPTEDTDDQACEVTGPEAGRYVEGPSVLAQDNELSGVPADSCAPLGWTRFDVRSRRVASNQARRTPIRPLIVPVRHDRRGARSNCNLDSIRRRDAAPGNRSRA